MPYPSTPGSKTHGPSAESARKVAGEARNFRDKVLALIKSEGPLTADECAVKLGESKLYVRPRLSELRGLGLIADTGTRRKNFSGLSATVWKPNP